MIILLTVGLVKMTSIYKMNYFPEPYTCSNNKLNDELDLSHYAAKSGLKITTGWYFRFSQFKARYW